MALLIFGSVCNLAGLILVLGAGHIRPRDREVVVLDDSQPKVESSWTIAIGGFLIIIGSAITTFELINRFG